ncbi:hypothetical protein [Paractinoplanes durhamensis]|uniref:hypothetical protein n=1 Tax=Paractinoplanes durhamensis TaxID=113563 RepID=UPI00363337E3
MDLSSSRKTLVSLTAALVAGGVLLFAPPGRGQSDTKPVSAALAWPGAKRGSLPADLPDGTAFTPDWFVDASTSIGTALSKDGKALRLLIRGTGGALRQFRQLPISGDVSFPAVTVSGDDVVWAEGHGNRSPQLWTAGLRDSRPPRQITGDTGDARFYQSEHDLLVADGRVHWVAAAANDGTEVRSVLLAGGPVEVTPQAGTWQLSAWPWLVDGVTSAAGATTLRNLTTGQDVAVPRNDRAVTNCSPTWCRVVSLTKDGVKIELVHPDGGNRQEVAEGTPETAITDVGVLDRFEVYALTGGNADLTGNAGLLIYDLKHKQTVEVSPDAANVVYRGGVLSWSTGTQDLFLRHSLDLRTV